jgi:AcrR family transcriptional regulator
MDAKAGCETRLRADAARNRQAIIEAARTLYAQRGLEIPLDDIARDAGVGNATLYRHFPSRCALVAAVFADALQRIVDAGERALDDADPWEGFTSHVRYLCRLQATDRALADLLTTQIARAPELEALRGRAYQVFSQLAARAQACGQLRADFVAEDIAMLLMANAGLVHRTAETAPTAWRRFIDLHLDGLRHAAASSANPSPGTEAVERTMQQHGHALGYRA